MKVYLIALLGAIGTLARYGLQGLVHLRMGSGFPYGTLLVNLSGCFLLGLIGQLTLNRMLVSADMRMAIAVGFFGGYTAFSSFGWEAANGCAPRRTSAPAWWRDCCCRWPESASRTDSKNLFCRSTL